MIMKKENRIDQKLYNRLALSLHDITEKVADETVEYPCIKNYGIDVTTISTPVALIVRNGIKLTVAVMTHKFDTFEELVKSIVHSTEPMSIIAVYELYEEDNTYVIRYGQNDYFVENEPKQVKVNHDSERIYKVFE